VSGDDSPRVGRIRGRIGRAAERRTLKRKQKVDRESRRLSSDPSGSWARQRGAGGGGGPS
jgi:hypothetical protein